MIKRLAKSALFLIFIFVFSVNPVFAACSQTESSNPKNTCFYRVNYKTLSKNLRFPSEIQTFSGDLTMAEFDQSLDTGSGQYYAGHIGSFWSPPFYSSHETLLGGVTSSPTNNGKSFFTSIGFYDRGSGHIQYEEPSSSETEAFWYPSKLELFKTYQNLGGGARVRGVKMALPGQKMALKIDLSSISNTPMDQDIFLF